LYHFNPLLRKKKIIPLFYNLYIF